LDRFWQPGTLNRHAQTTVPLHKYMVAMELRIGRIIKWGEGQGTKERLWVQIVYFYIVKIIQGVSVSYVFRSVLDRIRGRGCF
jgi:hypothetical protein